MKTRKKPKDGGEEDSTEGRDGEEGWGWRKVRKKFDFSNSLSLTLSSRELMLSPMKERMKEKIGFMSVDAKPGDGITFFVSLSKVNLFSSFKNFFRREVLPFLNTNTCNTLKEEIQSINILLFPITFSLEGFKKKSRDLKRMVKRRWWTRSCFLCKAGDRERKKERKRKREREGIQLFGTFVEEKSGKGLWWVKG